ncbi:ABC transporter ATP-binding protein [Subsaximicrobium wynnwilliamsii]|uniref:ABC transporter ATP-binding protein n=1 Tax=Subsaximicrobium wynnwilliamsii TaxID=291179 RepID=A0A5C6ZQI3_9FLAO|nr:ABC transporter ATP-binding protein [Subsaximicrobium wynnwilliamsii]TXD85150.1 ABC transporter ATP-binding protein [Subsaximicrobium wynnwilliamsii]TXD91193.1 ABC transporter ATP-binding protein [Subsaximicrobium wynnwilliamsii]TXE04587.1 ABC transporter ATP-binding protein [Subsaximicrobium wynnwilliamsii]
MKELKHINKYFYKYRFQLLLGILITIVAKVFALFTPRLIGNAVTTISHAIKGTITTETFRHDLGQSILYLIGAAVVAGILTFFMRQTIINVSRYIEFDLKNEVYQQYQNLSLNFYKSNKTGDLINRISEDVGKVRNYTGPAIMYTINMITLFGVAFIYMFNTAPSLTLYTILPLPVLSFIVYKLSAVINKRSRIVQEYLSTLSAYTQESFSGISVIKSYGIETQNYAEFNTLSTESKEKQIDLAKVQALFFPSMILLIGVSNILVAYVGGVQYMNGQIAELGTIAEFLIYVNMLTWPVATVGWVTNLVQQAEASQKRINEFLKEVPEIKNHTNTQTPIKGRIAFENVTFIYSDTNIQALTDVNFTLEKGETLAILGKTGSGKSTILDLIGRLYDVQKGSIKIDDRIIDQINLKNLRDNIGYVPQDAFLFSDTIKNNIMFGKEDATEDEVIEAAKNASVHKNIMKFNKAYNTKLGERGITLSGGQKQRISIARALIKAPEIMLFDDCLSAVDTETEEKILNNLRTVSDGKTTIIVSHRVSSAKNADKIIVLSEGKIIQTGTHESLIDKDGYYRDLYLKQLSTKEME